MPKRSPENIAELMQFIANKTKNVTSPISVKKLCRQFKTESGSLLSMGGLVTRIRSHRLRIHEINEFDMDTKIKMIFALSAPVNPKFLIEMKKVADVEVDDQQRIIQYKQKDGGLELSAKHIKLSISQSEQRNKDVIQFLAKKSEAVDTPIPDKLFLREFKEKTGCSDSMDSLHHRYDRLKNTIFEKTDVNKNTKIKMMFMSNTKLPEDILEKLRQDAVVEVDEVGKITKYKANDGSLDLEGSHEKSSIMKSVLSDRWKKICQKADNDESKEDERDGLNWPKAFEKKRIDLVRFLIEKTKNTTAPLSIAKLAENYDTEFKSPAKNRTQNRIENFRQRIHEINQFDISTKVKMLFALSAPIDAKFLKELQKDANVEVDDNHRIKKYKAKDGSLELEGDHSRFAKIRAVLADKKMRKVVNDSSESEKEGDDEEYSSEYDESEEEEERENVEESTRSKHTPTSSAVRKSDRLQKSRFSRQNKNKKRQLSEKSSDFIHTQDHARMSRGKKRARISDSSSETKHAGDSLNYEENHIPVEQKPESLIDLNNSDEFDYDPSKYELDMDHLPIDKKPESLIEVNTEESSTTIVGNHYEEIFLEYDQLNDVDDMEHIPEEKKPESLLEVKTEVPEEPSGGVNGLIDPKIEEFTREVKQEAEEDEEGTSATFSMNVSLFEFLRHFRRPAIKLNIPFVANKIDNEIKKLEEKDQQIPINTIIESLESCIQILKTPDEMHSDKVTIFLSDFIDHLGSSMCYIAHPLMNELQRKLGKLVAAEEQKIPMEHIRYAMEETLDKILH